MFTAIKKEIGKRQPYIGIVLALVSTVSVILVFRAHGTDPYWIYVAGAVLANAAFLFVGLGKGK
ncbi:MAG: hypothetical protein JKY60_07640 [Kordiimonadaceae bacterium]|nr:hypothetical protein [Kordiimonadaceae bacterium]